MRDGNDFNPVRGFAVNDQERETMENAAPPGSEDAPPTPRRLVNFPKRVVDFIKEFVRSAGTSFPVP